MSISGLHVIVGLGKTGMSCARYLAQKNLDFAVTDSRTNPPDLAEFTAKFPDVPIHLGGFDQALLTKAKEIIIGPGVPLDEPVIANCIKQGIPIIGDIELFARAASAPIVAITGSNAKGTVTTLVAAMASAAGLKVRLGGNIGIPALDLLTDTEPDVYILELSSFQLETTFSLAAAAAAILNISVDHLDRHKTLAAYIAAKQRIYNNCQAVVYNLDDANTWPVFDTPTMKMGFTLTKPEAHQFGIMETNHEVWLAQGEKKLLPVSQLLIKGRHNWANALAALALGSAIYLPEHIMLQALTEFPGLPHRCQWVAERNGVQWYNDSKGTNVGATLAAIEGLGSTLTGKIILIAGGLGKGADFTPLKQPVAKYVSQIILMGKDAPILEQVLAAVVPVSNVIDMREAVSLANNIARPGDCVLLSPACASYDMFNGFEHRGEIFVAEVKGLSS